MEDGSLKAIGQEADKASDKVDKLGKSARSADRNLKGAANMTSNTTKSFSKMSQGITGGLVPAYATLAANVFALSAAFNFFKRAADVKILEEGQVSYAKNTGLGLQTITKGLREASGGMLGFREAAEAAAIGVAKGFSPKQLEDLAVGARKASAALGRNFEDSFDRLIRGASKAEPELLDELGITLRLETATKKYGEAIGKSAKELTAFERSQAVLIETQRQLDSMFGSMEGKSNPFVTLSKTFEDIIKGGTNFIMPLFEGLAKIINGSAVSAIAVFGLLSVSILKAMIPVGEIKEKFKDFQDTAAASADKAARRQAAYNKLLDKTKKKLEEAKGQSIQGAAKGMQGSTSKLVKKAQAGQLTDPKQIGQLKSTLKKAEAEYKKTGKIAKGVFKGVAIEQVRSLRTALATSDKHQMSFFKKMKMRYKGLTLTAQKHYMSVKAAGTRAFAAIGRGAAVAGKMMNKAMKMAGIIGAFMMVLEIGQQLLQAPMTIVMGILKGVDFIVKGAMKALGMLIDGIGNMWAGIYNTIVSGVNFLAEFVGLEAPIELLSTSTTTATDYMENLADSSINLAGTFKDSSYGSALQGFQDRRVAAAEETQAYEDLKEAIKGVGTELDNIAAGVAKQKGAKKETSAATGLATLGISSKIEDAMGVKDPDKKANAIALIRKELAQVGALSPKVEKLMQGIPDAMSGVFVEVVENGKKVQKQLTNLEAIKNIETSAQAATGGLGALKDGIQNINQALSAGDLVQAEFALAALGGTADTTSNAFKAIFGEDSKAATKALADFEAAFSGPTMTSTQFLKNLKDLRIASEALAISQAASSLVGGTFAETFKLQNEVAAAGLEIKAKELEIEKERDPVKQAQLQTELKLLQVAQQKANIALQGNTQGSGMAAASSSSALAGEGLQAQMSPMLGELAKLGPEGELIQSVVNGAFAIQDAFSNAFAVMGDKGATVGDKVQAGLEVAATAMNAIGGIMKQASKQQIAEFDQQINAEKKRDGKSKESVAKIAALEKKKEQAKRKAFERDKKIQMAQVIVATATAIMKSVAASPLTGGLPFSAVAAGIGAAQLAIISGTSYQGGGSAGAAPSGPSSVSVGERKNTVDLARGENQAGELAYARGAQGMGQGMTNFKPAFSGYKNRAAGGFVVGEQGPELFMPDTPGQIIPSGQGVGGQTNVNFSISAVDARGVEDLLINQRGNIIGMIREAANEHGEMFLESVQEKSY